MTGSLGAAQHVGDGVVVGQRAGAAVEHEQDDVGRGDGALDLLADVAGERSVFSGVVAAGVDEQQAVARPLHLDLFAVARDARRLVHHGGSRAGEAVHKGGFAGVRRTDDGDDGECFHPDSLANASPRDPATTRRPPQAAAKLVLGDVVERAAEVLRQPDARGQRATRRRRAGRGAAPSRTSAPPSSPVTVTCGAEEARSRRRRTRTRHAGRRRRGRAAARSSTGARERAAEQTHAGDAVRAAAPARPVARRRSRPRRRQRLRLGEQRRGDADAVLVLLGRVAGRRLLAGEQVELVGGVHEGRRLAARGTPRCHPCDGGDHRRARRPRVTRRRSPSAASETGTTPRSATAVQRAGAQHRLGEHVAVVPARAEHDLQVQLEAGRGEPLEDGARAGRRPPHETDAGGVVPGVQRHVERRQPQLLDALQVGLVQVA